MSTSTPRAARGRVAFATLLAVLFGGLASTAQATQSLSYQAASSKLIDSDAHHYWNQGATEQNKLVTFNGYQYSVFWDSDDQLNVSRRKLSDNTLQQIEFSGTAYKVRRTDDTHYTTVLGISKNNGRLHVSFGHHGDPHNYIQSDANFVTSPPTTISTSHFTKITAPAGEQNITYPRYFTDKAGDLYFIYRDGSTTNGNTMLKWYHTPSNAWWDMGKLLAGKSGNGCFTSPLSESTCVRGPYTTDILFDDQDRLHLAWSWRETLGTNLSGYTDHDLNYAYSDDAGVTWFNEDGVQVADLNNADPITVLDDTVAVTVPMGYLLHGGGLVIDSHRQPHIVTNRAVTSVFDFNEANLQRIHYWRNTSGVWQSEWLTPTGTWTHGFRQNPAKPFMDGGDNLYLIHSVENLGWVSTEASDWEIRDFGWRTGGIVTGTKNAAFGEIETLGIKENITGFNTIQIRMKNDSNATTARLDYLVAADMTADAGKSKTFAVTPNSGWTTYTVDMSTTSDWTGTLRQLFFNPMWTSGSSGSFSLDWIRITDGTNVTKAWEFTKGWELNALESNPTNDYATAQQYTLGTGEYQTLFDEGYQLDLARFASDRIVSVPSVEMDQTNGLIKYATREFSLTNTAVARAWEFASDKEEWVNQNNVTSWSWSGGQATGTIAATNAEIFTSGDLNVPISSTTNRYIKIRMRNTTSATSAKIYFLTEADGTWNVAKSKTFTITANSGYTDYVVDMGTVAGWTGKLDTLNLYPAPAASSGSFGIDWIRIQPTT